MALSKTGSNVVVSGSVSAGSAQDAVNSGDIDLTAVTTAMIIGEVTNGATGPTIGCTVNCYVSKDGTNYYLYDSITAGVTNSGVYPFSFYLPEPVMHAKIGFGGNTVQNVTAVADLMTFDHP